MIRRPGIILLMLAVMLPQLAGCVWRRPRLRAAFVGKVLVPNRRIETRTMWANSRPLRVPVFKAGGRGFGAPRTRSFEVELRAVHDGQYLSILAIWPDRTESDPRRAWIWDSGSRHYFLRENETDMFAFKFRLSGDEEACMMTGAEGVYDMWLWRGGWSHVFGLAEDMTLTLSRTPPDSQPFHTYIVGDSDRHVFIQWTPDRGQPAYEPIGPPKQFTGRTQYAIRAAYPTGSRGDVLAESIHQDRSQLLEVRRALKTGHPDDYAFEGAGPHVFAIAVADSAEGAEHYTSGLIELFFE